MAKDLYQLGIYYAIGKQPGMNVLHFRADEENTENPDRGAHELEAAWVATMETKWLGILSENVAIVGYKAKRVNNGGGPSIAAARNSIAGGRVGDFGASGVGPCLIWNYQKSTGGWAAGRTFIPTVSEDDMDQNGFAADFVTDVTTVFTQLLMVPCFTSPVDAIDFEFVIYSPTHSSSSGVESASLSGKPGIMNKRMKPTF